MALLDNLGFEVPGANLGDADAWAVGSVGGAESTVVLGGDAEEEGFEVDWDAAYLFALGAAVGGHIFEGEVGVEAFTAWVPGYLLDLSGVVVLAADGFEAWDAAYLFALDGVAALAADGFEAWDVAYLFALDGVAGASFDGAAPEAVEDFEEVRPEFPFVVDPAADVLTAEAHGLGDWDVVTFRAGAGALPGGLLSSYPYYVRDATADTFKVAAWNGGGTVDVTDTGVGDVYVRSDPTLYWLSEV